MPVEKDFETKEAFLACLRDWFAGQALIAKASQAIPSDIAFVGSVCYGIADNMIAAREGK